MRTLKALCFAAIASIGLATTASAQTFSPDGPRTITSLGTVTVTKGLVLSCDASGTASVTGGAAQVDSLALSGISGGVNCAAISFTSAPYSITSSSPTSLTFNNVTVTAITGSCAGNITGTYDQATGVLSFVNATLPTTTAGPNCAITGDLLIDPAITF